MQLRPDALDAHLARTLAPVYAVRGDEPLLALEAADAVRAAARKRGFAEREVFEVARGFDWSELRGSLGSLSLFATRKIVELRMPGGKPGTQGAEALAAYAAQPAADTLLVGDRLLTDVRMAHEAGMASALVLTGATSRSAVADAPYAPDYVLDGVAQILPADRLKEVS